MAEAYIAKTEGAHAWSGHPGSTVHHSVILGTLVTMLQHYQQSQDMEPGMLSVYRTGALVSTTVMAAGSSSSDVCAWDPEAGA